MNEANRVFLRTTLFLCVHPSFKLCLLTIVGHEGKIVEQNQCKYGLSTIANLQLFSATTTKQKCL